MSESILQEAQRIIHGARNQDYGHPLDNHGCTADLWRAWLRRRFGADLALTPEDVCMLNILQKASRGANVLTRDTLVDMAGFSGNAEMVQDERARRQSANSL